MRRLIALVLTTAWLWAAVATPAGAIPAAAVVAFFASVGVAVSATVATVVAFVVNVAISIGVNALSSKLFGPKLASDAQARQAAVLSLTLGEAPRQAIFGRTATGGLLKDAFNFGGANGTDWEVLVIKVADHKCDALEGFILNDTLYAFVADGAVTGFNGQLEVYWKNGDPAQTASSYLVTNSASRLLGTPWTTNDVCASEAYVIFAYKADAPNATSPVWPQGRPSFKPVVRGKLCYDPRKDSTVAGGSGAHRWATPSTWEWSENAAICDYNFDLGVYALDAVTDPKSLLVGRGLSLEQAPASRVAARANVCDEAVALKAGGTEPRYRVGGVVFANQAFEDVKQQFADAMGGDIVKRLGGVEVLPGAAQSTVAEITDANFLVGEAVSYEPFLSDVDRINVVTPHYNDPTQLYKTTAAPIRRSTSDITADGGQKVADVPLDLVTSGTQAQRIGEIKRRLGRMEKRLAVVLPPTFAHLEDGDWVGVTSTRYFSGARIVFRVDAYAVDSGYVSHLVLREIASSAYSWTAASDEGTPGQAPVDEFGSLTAVALSGVAFAAVSLVGAAGVTQPAIKAAWTVPVDSAIRAVVLEVRKVGATDPTPSRQDEPNAGTIQTTSGVMSATGMEARLIPVPFDPTRTVTATAWTAVTSTSLSTPNRITTSASAPASPATGDVWVKLDGNGRVTGIAAWDGSAWVDASTRNNVTRSSSAPATPTVNDIWAQLDGSGNLIAVFVWSGSAWVKTSDVTSFFTAAAITGQGALATLNQVTWATQVTGAGKPDDFANKVLVYRQVSAPGSPGVNDIWCQLDGLGNPQALWVWNGSVWINGADKTIYNTAAAITAQGAWATASVPGGLTPTQVNGRTQYFSSSTGILLDYRGMYWGYSVDGVAGRSVDPLTSNGTQVFMASHTVQLYRTGFTSGFGISVPAATFSGLTNSTAYTVFYRPDFGDSFCPASAFANNFIASQDGYMLIGSIKTADSSGNYVPPGSTTAVPSTTFNGSFIRYECVGADALLASGKRAGNAVAGDDLTLMSPAGDRVLAGVVEAIHLADADCITIETAYGAVLTLSDSTPLMTRAGEGFIPYAVKACEAAEGLAVPVLLDGDVLAWDVVTRVAPAGRRSVAKITVQGIGVYAAGDRPDGPRLFTHNGYNKP